MKKIKQTKFQTHKILYVKTHILSLYYKYRRSSKIAYIKVSLQKSMLFFRF
jgi:hypothetical protein